jgi:hypothetical protein
MSQSHGVQVNADDVIAVMAREHSELFSKFAHSEARRLYLEKRVEALEKVISEQSK